MFMMAPEQQSSYQCCATFVLSKSCEADIECMREYGAKFCMFVCAGLFTLVNEQPPELSVVPLEVFGRPHAVDPARSNAAQALAATLGCTARRRLRTQHNKGRAWIQGDYLKVHTCGVLATLSASALSLCIAPTHTNMF